jgi:hypothetical protein
MYLVGVHLTGVHLLQAYISQACGMGVRLSLSGIFDLGYVCPTLLTLIAPLTVGWAAELHAPGSA